jgi:hypothetical protein
VWFQSLQLPSTQSESPLALIPLDPKSNVSFKVCTQLWTEFVISQYFDPVYPTAGLTVAGLASVYIFRSGLSDSRINCSRISECLHISSRIIRQPD